ncbi:MAG: VOC family protein [Candidatus Aenigmatarchaeota archaeon]
MKPKSAQNSTLIELHVPSFEKAKKFYNKLGFKVVWENRPKGVDGYLVMKCNNNILCFWPGNKYVWDHEYFKYWPKNTKRGYAVEIVVMVDDVEKFYERVRKFSKVVEELKVQPWGLKDFRIEDPFGFYIRITETHNILNSENIIQ